MNTYPFQINIAGYRTPWSLVAHHTRRFRSRSQAEKLAIRAAKFYNAGVRLSSGKDPLHDSGAYFRSPSIK